MKTSLDYIRLLLLATSGMLVACSVLIVLTEQDNGIIEGKQHWFFLTLLWFTISVLFCVITLKGKIYYHFSWADILLLIGMAYIALSYQWKVNPAPDKLMVVALLFALWFLLRLTLSSYSFLSTFFLFIFIYTGAVEALWGIGQVFHFIRNDANYLLTGSFFQPEAYAGYQALVLPLSLSMALRYRNCNKKQWWNIRTALYHSSIFSIACIVIILPAGMSRISLIAAIFSCLWVAWIQLSWSKKIKSFLKSGRRIMIPAFILIPLLGAGILFTVVFINNDSLAKKIHIWQVTSSVISERPVLGSGMGQFQNTYIRHAPANPEMLATIFDDDTPMYAFNEYLQLIVEHGVIGLLIFLGIMVSCFLYGLKHKQTGVCGTLISLAILSIASYPLQLPSFLITIVFILAICMVDKSPLQTKQSALARYYKANALTSRKWNVKILASSILITTLLYAAFIHKKNTFNHFYIMHPDKREAFIPSLCHYPSFLCENAQYLNKIKLYNESNIILKKAIRFSNSPLLYTLMARNYQALGKYDFAEKCLLVSINLLPEKMALYLELINLYGEPSFCQPEKTMQLIGSIITKKAAPTFLRDENTKKAIRKCGLLTTTIQMEKKNKQSTRPANK